MWRLLFAKLFGCKVCMTKDFDGEIRWRFVYQDPFGGYMCRAISGWVHLNSDGTVNTPGHSYITHWTMAA